MVSGINLLNKAPQTKVISGTGLTRSYSFDLPETAAPYKDIITETESTYGLPKNLLPVLLNTESNFNPEAKSPAGAIGIAQIVPKYHPDVDPTDPIASIKYSGKHLRDLYEQFGDWDQAIAAYNAGAGNVKKLWPDRLPKETKGYLDKFNQYLDTPKNKAKAVKSGMDLLQLPKPAATPLEETQTPERIVELGNVQPDEVRSYYNSMAQSPYGGWSPSVSAVVGKMGYGPKPEGGWDEFGRPLDAKGIPYIKNKQIKPDKIQQAIGDTLSGLKDLATDPYETARGVFDFALSVPAFLVGLVGAAGRVGKELVDQTVGDASFDMERVYNAASKGLQESFEFFQPGKEALIGKPTEKSQKVGEIAMAPITAWTELAHYAASDPFYDDSPNIRGFLKFAGDFVGLTTMGILLKGRNRRQEFTKDTDEIVQEAADITKAREKLSEVPDDITRMIMEKELEIKKARLENKAKAHAKKFEGDALVIEEIGRQAEEIAKAKIRPVQETGIPKFASESTKFDYEFTSKKGNTYYKAGDTWYDANGVEVTNKHKVGALEKNKVEFGKSSKQKESKPEPGKLSGEIHYSAVRPELHEIFDFIGETDLKRKRKFIVREHTLEEGQKGKVPPTWHDATYRFTVFRDADGNLMAGASGSYDTILNTGAARGGEGALPPGSTAYIIDLGPGNVRSINIYRSPRVMKDAKAKAPIVENKRAPRRKKIVAPPAEEPVIEVDRQTGVKVPEADDSVSLFLQNKKRTQQLGELFKERGEKIMGDPELVLQKLINDVNRWLHGEKVDIDNVRSALSDLASISEDLRGEFLTGRDHLMWKETAQDAAAWARKVNRGNVRLNMMIPLDQVPSMLKDMLKKMFPGASRIKMGDVLRNKKIWKETGFWLGKDGLWRFELNDLGAKVTDNVKHYRNVAVNSTMAVRAGLKDVLDHPKLFETVPGLEDITVVFDATLPTAGRSNIVAKEITINPIFKDDFVKSVLIHEVQHLINRSVGAFPGANSRSATARRYANMLESIIGDLNPKYRSQLKGVVDHLRTTGDEKHFEQVIMPALKAHGKDIGLNADHLRLLDKPSKELTNRLYETTPGEIEARLSQFRRDIGARGRKEIAPWESLDRMMKEEGYTELVGHKLYSGDPMADVIAQKIKNSSAKVAKYMDKARGFKKLKPREVARVLRSEFNRNFIDRSGNIRIQTIKKLGDDGYRLMQKAYLSKGSSALASNMLRQMQKEVYRGLSDNLKRILDNVILSERMIDIGKYKGPKEFKHPDGMKLEDFIRYRYTFDRFHKLTREQAAEINARTEAYFEWMKKPLKEMLDSGLISESEYNDLVSHNYRRIEKVNEAYDRRRTYKIGAKRRTVYDSGIESLQRGRDTDIYEPSSEVMALEVFNRAYNRILNNEANKELLSIAQKHPDNPFVRVKSKERKIPHGWNKIKLFDKGEKKTVYLEPEFSKEWITATPEVSSKVAKILGWALGAPILRTFATGINWGFAIANLPRDVLHTWFTARTLENGKWKPIYNPNLPIFGLQIGRDLATVFYDAATKGERYQAYIREGGGMEFLVHQGRLLRRGKHLEGGVDKLFNILGYFGETSELMTRLAIRERVLRRKARQNGVSLEEARRNPEISREATFTARDYMDFGQGGAITKALDLGIPYLNATVQGTRGLYRAFKPGSGSAISSVYKLTQLAALTTGIYLTAKAMHPKTMQNLKGNVDDVNNLIIPLGDQYGFEDEFGQMRYPYVKIPLDPSQRFFKQVFQAGADKWLGDPVDVDRLIDTLNEQSPVKVTESLPPTISGALGYFSNKDFWLNEDIWKSTNKPFDWPESKEEFTPGKTPQFYIDVGEFTGLSPERTKYAVEELVTSGTMWSYLMGKGYDELFAEMPENQKQQHLAMVLSDLPITGRFIGVTNPYSKYAENISESEQASTLKKFVENRGVDTLIDQYLYEGTADRKAIFDYIDKFQDKQTQDRLRDRFKWEEAIKNLPEKSFWRRMKGLNTDARAQVFVDRLNSSTPDEKAKLWEEYSIVSSAGGIISKNFRKEVLDLLD